MENSTQFGSVITPCFNEQDNIAAFYAALTGVPGISDVIGEIIFVDDGSTDNTYEVVRSLAEKDHRVKCLRFSRNFGSHAALSAGLRRASGAFAVILSADLQDPPELIPELVKQWQAGFHVVWATRRSREDSGVKKELASLFYTVLRRIALPQYPPEGMDFGLFDRRVLDEFKAMGETQPFITGAILWMGFRQTTIPYDRRSRRSGSSKWSMSKMIKLAIAAIAGFSSLPVRLVSVLGAVLCAIGLCGGALLVLLYLAGVRDVWQWFPLAAILFVLQGIQLLMLGIVGEYVLKGAEQANGRPPFIVMEELGFDSEK